MALRLEIVTPDHSVYDETVDSVVLPTTSGEVGILPGHIPLLTVVEPGELRVTQNGRTVSLAVDKGFAEVIADEVRVLAEAAIEVDSIDLSQVEEARQRAEEALRKAEAEGLDPAEVEQAETVVRFSSLQQLLKQRR